MAVRGSLTAAALLFAGMAGAAPAQAQAVLPQLVPGGSDTVFDTIGISTGMACAEAFRIARGRIGYGNPRITDRIRQIGIEGEQALVPIKGFQMQQTAINGGREEIRVECTAAAGEQVYFIDRRLRFEDGVDLDQLVAEIEGKYGFPSLEVIKDEWRVRGVFFNAAGPIRQAGEECGRFAFNTPDGAIATRGRNVELSACSYALYVILTTSRQKPRLVTMMNIVIFDFARFVKAWQAIAK